MPSRNKKTLYFYSYITNSLMSFSLLLLSIIILFSLFVKSSLAAEYVVGVRAKGGIDKAIQQWQPTLDYLSDKLTDHTFKLKPIVSLEKITYLAGESAFDFLITNPSSYVEVKHLYGAQALATLNNRRANTAQNRFGAVIFTHAKRDDIVNISDLKNKHVMGVSEASFGGWRVAWAEMLARGVDPLRDFEKLSFADGLQKNVVYAVRDGVADVGVVRTDQLERMEASGEIDMRYFRVINNKDINNFPFFLSSALYPEWVFASVNQVSSNDLIAEIKTAFLEMPEDSHAADAGKYVGWIEPLDYALVEVLLRKLKVGPFGD